MKHIDPSQNEPITDQSLAHWAQAFSHVADHYRVACSPGALVADAPWLSSKPMISALTLLAREAGLSFQLLHSTQDAINSWRLPLVVELKEGKIGVIEYFDGEDTLEICFIDSTPQSNRLSLQALLPAIHHVAALRPLAALKDSRVDAYISKYRPDWLYRLVMRDLRPYTWVMLAALFINLLSLSGVVFSMQVYDRVIPAQSYPTLYVLTIGVLIATLFGFVLRIARGHIMDLLGKRADLRVSDRVFGHALRLRNSAVPRSTGSFISQLRELEQIREMVTSSTISTIVDLPFFLLFVVVLATVSYTHLRAH
ncbi:type I secretion system permease/ATPase, partial [Enterobacter sp. 63]